MDIENVLHSHAARLRQVALEMGDVVDFLESCGPSLDIPLQQTLGRLAEILESLLTGIENPKERDFPEALWRNLLRLETKVDQRRDSESTSVASIEPVADLAQQCLSQIGQIPRPKVNNSLWRQLRQELLSLVWTVRSEVLAESHKHLEELVFQTKSVLSFLSSSAPAAESAESLRLAEIIAEAVRMETPLANQKGVEFRNRIGNTRVFGVRSQLTRMFANIFNNAVKYSFLTKENYAWVDIRGKVEENTVRVEIESWGLAIPEDELGNNKLLELGYRGSLARRSGYEGHGIGLAEVERILDANGGHLEIRSRPADGGDKVDASLRKPYVTTVTLALRLSPTDSSGY